MTTYRQNSSIWRIVFGTDYYQEFFWGAFTCLVQRKDEINVSRVIHNVRLLSNVATMGVVYSHPEKEDFRQ